MAAFDDRLRDLKLKISAPPTKKTKPREVYDILRRVRETLQAAQQVDWILLSKDDTIHLSYAHRKGLARSNTLIGAQFYENGWPVTLNLASPSYKESSLIKLNPKITMRRVITHSLKDFEGAILDHLDTPQILDWLRTLA